MKMQVSCESRVGDSNNTENVRYTSRSFEGSNSGSTVSASSFKKENDQCSNFSTGNQLNTVRGSRSSESQSEQKVECIFSSPLNSNPLPSLESPSDSKLRPLHVLLLGSSSVGKTSLIQRFVYGTGQQCTQTATLDVSTLQRRVSVAGKSYLLHVYDTAGQERFYSLVRSLYRRIDVAILVFSVEDTSSLQGLRYWLTELERHGPTDDISKFPVLVVGNKSDVTANQRTVTMKAAKIWCLTNGDLPYMETSATSGVNVEETFKEGVKLCLRQFKKTLRVQRKNTLRLQKSLDKKTSRRCF